MNIDDDVEMWFMYDGNGPMVLKYGDAEDHEEYHYELNLQGDVVGIINSAGERVVEYKYDAWGNVLSITGSAKDTIGAINPGDMFMTLRPGSITSSPVITIPR